MNRIMTRGWTHSYQIWGRGRDLSFKVATTLSCHSSTEMSRNLSRGLARRPSSESAGAVVALETIEGSLSFSFTSDLKASEDIIHRQTASYITLHTHSFSYWTFTGPLTTDHPVVPFGRSLAA